MTKIITVYRKYDNTIVVKIHRAYSRIYTKEAAAYLKKRIIALIVAVERIYYHATKHERVGT